MPPYLIFCGFLPPDITKNGPGRLVFSRGGIFQGLLHEISASPNHFFKKLNRVLNSSEQHPMFVTRLLQEHVPMPFRVKQ